MLFTVRPVDVIDSLNGDFRIVPSDIVVILEVKVFAIHEHLRLRRKVV